MNKHDYDKLLADIAAIVKGPEHVDGVAFYVTNLSGAIYGALDYCVNNFRASAKHRAAYVVVPVIAKQKLQWEVWCAALNNFEPPQTLIDEPFGRLDTALDVAAALNHARVLRQQPNASGWLPGADDSKSVGKESQLLPANDGVRVQLNKSFLTWCARSPNVTLAQVKAITAENLTFGDVCKVDDGLCLLLPSLIDTKEFPVRTGGVASIYTDLTVCEHCWPDYDWRAFWMRDGQREDTSGPGEKGPSEDKPSTPQTEAKEMTTALLAFNDPSLVERELERLKRNNRSLWSLVLDDLAKRGLTHQALRSGHYRHYKGGDYHVLGCALHSETAEPLVVYRSATSPDKLWVRPLSMFTETVTVTEGNAALSITKEVPRFEYIGPVAASEQPAVVIAAAAAASTIDALRNNLETERNRWETRAQHADDTIIGLKQWVADLQSGMYVNCVYCGHNYGPKDKVPTSMAEVLKDHIKQCPEHPMSKLQKQHEAVRLRLIAEVEACTRCNGTGSYKVPCYSIPAGGSDVGGPMPSVVAAACPSCRPLREVLRSLTA